MRLDRRRLRRLIKEEYSKVLKEMYMGGRGHMGGGHMGGGHMGMSPDHPDYDLVPSAIQKAFLSCVQQGVHSSDEQRVKMCCMQACQDYGLEEHFNYVCEKVIGMLRMSGM